MDDTFDTPKKGIDAPNEAINDQTEVCMFISFLV